MMAAPLPRLDPKTRELIGLWRDLPADCQDRLLIQARALSAVAAEIQARPPLEVPRPERPIPR